MADGFPNNTVNNSTSHSQDVAGIIVMSGLMILTVLANSGLCWVIHTNRKLQTIPNKFVLNLAWCDLLTAIINGPFTLDVLVQGDWRIGGVFCQINGFMTTVFGIASVVTLAVISINRCCLIVYTSKCFRLFTRRKTTYMIIGIWAFSIACAFPPTIGWSKYSFIPGKAICTLIWSTDVYYTLVVLSLGVLAPFVVMVVSYTKIFLRVKASSRAMAAHLAKNSSRSTMETVNDSAHASKCVPLVQIINENGNGLDNNERLIINDNGNKPDSNAHVDIKPPKISGNGWTSGKGEALNLRFTCCAQAKEVSQSSSSVHAQHSSNMSDTNPQMCEMDILPGVPLLPLTPMTSRRPRRQTNSLPTNEYLYLQTTQSGWFAPSNNKSGSLCGVCSVTSQNKEITNKRSSNSLCRRWSWDNSINENSVSHMAKLNGSISVRNLSMCNINSYENTDQGNPEWSALKQKDHLYEDIPDDGASVSTLMSSQEDSLEILDTNLAQTTHTLLKPPQDLRSSSSSIHKAWKKGVVSWFKDNDPDITHKPHEGRGRWADELKLTLTLFIVVFVFAVCWAPISVVNFVETLLHYSIPVWLDRLTVYMVFAQCAINPIVYGIMNRTFREGFKKLLKRK